MTLYLVALDRNRTMTWRGSHGLEFLGLGSPWLTSTSLGWRGGSSFMTPFAIAITASVVSSCSCSGIPDILRLFRRPYCSRASKLSHQGVYTVREVLVGRLNDLRQLVCDDWVIERLLEGQSNVLILLCWGGSHWRLTSGTPTLAPSALVPAAHNPWGMCLVSGLNPVYK